MDISSFLPRSRRWFAGVLLCTTALASAAATDDPPGRVGRLAEMQGGVSAFDHEQGQWTEAQRNLPLTAGDRLSTAPQGRAEVRVGSTVLRLSGGTELEVLRLDDERMAFQLYTGSVALRVRTREVAEEVELLTPEARLLPLRAGHYRLDRIDDHTQAGVWRGSLQVDDAASLVIETGQRLDLWRSGRRGEPLQLHYEWSTLPDDAFAAWAQGEDRRDERSAATRFVSPEMTGAEDLDRYGRWEESSEYGALWLPYEVRSDWAPYRYGRWTWVRPWGWTWVDEAPWGFAPFHYGRWVYSRNRWGWAPGSYVARPVYAPALVAWLGGNGPGVAWVALGPLDFFVPWYRSTPVYVDRINNRHDRPGRRPPPQVPTGPIMYGNRAAPGAVTMVPRDVLMRRQPVGRAVMGDTPDFGRRGPGQPPMRAVEPPARDPRPPVTVSPSVAPPPVQRDATPPTRRDRRLPVPRDLPPPVHREAPAPVPREAPAPDGPRRDWRMTDRNPRDRVQPVPDAPVVAAPPPRHAPPQPPQASPAPMPVPSPAPGPAPERRRERPAPVVSSPAPAAVVSPAPAQAPPRAAPPPSPAPVVAPAAPRPRQPDPQVQKPAEDGRKERPEGRPNRDRENQR